ncbi:2-amino-4-hydroxy-6-hydroxymethyldihydropteridine diphosphokinase [Microbacterium sediminis]|uniref:2-amino-4-hydroxy-6-hydroxymethyldihydropteridine diphosphokinase n=1 Tax=Microbacterium sediminis TaxID=904291 RepID=A0A1B9NHS7_9MICO|nr:2-amino-4-hydroxy-6-hydroxymethyldihydropteridine diphosphokinase [Microbacterium sediminis]OCG76114.1 2-amino-4-hydroxy-6-hydroxymethyldihydropteridine diphosphokinase [Microbacterium sediminis]QBR73312.1 2-amino-4-hydroxy-6-hydroxymethyldihydropteridine diphosphokinase [Microbacterium sediminis]
MSRRLTEPLPERAPREPGREVEAVVALGSNLGDRARLMAEAMRDLRHLPLTDLVAASDPIESVALTLDGPSEERPAYLNAVAIVRTRLAPDMLLAMLHVIESRHGRVRGEVWADRTLDLDLISYGDVISDDERLRLPHPRAAERDFVLEPWLSIDPDAVLPGYGPVALLAARLRGTAGASAPDGERSEEP